MAESQVDLWAIYYLFTLLIFTYLYLSLLSPVQIVLSLFGYFSFCPSQTTSSFLKGMCFCEKGARQSAAAAEFRKEDSVLEEKEQELCKTKNMLSTCISW